MTGRAVARAAAVLVGLVGVVLGVLALIEGYRVGVAADETGTVGYLPPTVLTCLLAAPVLVCTAVVQLVALRGPAGDAARPPV